MGSRENFLEGSEGRKRTIHRKRGRPQTRDRGKKFWRVHDRRREPRGSITVTKISGKGYAYWNMIRDVGPSIVLVRKRVEVLIGSKRGDRVVVPVPIGG